jgi:hypothetical protein
MDRERLPIALGVLICAGQLDPELVESCMVGLSRLKRESIFVISECNSSAGISKQG